MSARQRATDPAIDATIAAVALLAPKWPTADMVRRVVIAHHGSAPSVRTIRRRLARLRAKVPTVTCCCPRAAFAGAGAVGIAAEARGNTAGVRVCRVCECTEHDACVDLFGGPCHWVEADLCSACVWEVAPYRGVFRGASRPRAAFAGAGAVGVVRAAAVDPTHGGAR